MFPRFAEIAVGMVCLVACSPGTQTVTSTSPTTPTLAPAVQVTDPNIKSTVTPQSAPTENTLTGFLTGHVTIGPLQPVQRAGPPATPAPQVYAARTIDVFLADGITRVAKVRIDSDGNYRIALPPGTYIVALARNGIDRARGLPTKITIENGRTVQLDVDIDTGIR